MSEPIVGVMWEWNRPRPLGWYEYQEWMTKLLPMGWSIIAKPDCYAEPDLFDPLIHSARWAWRYPFLAAAEGRIWRDDFDPAREWVKYPSKESRG